MRVPRSHTLRHGRPGAGHFSGASAKPSTLSLRRSNNMNRRVLDLWRCGDDHMQPKGSLHEARGYQ